VPCRLRGALRRLDVRTPDEFDEEEYSEGAAAMKDAVRGLAFCTLPKEAAAAVTGLGAAADPYGECWGRPIR
jgi:hypothetical protein